MKRFSAIHSLFLGFIFVFIDISIGGFDIVNDMLGLLIINYGLYHLKDISKLFLKGLYFSILNLSWQIFCFVLSFSAFSKQYVPIIVVTVIGLVLNAAMTYFTLSGLAELAAAQGLNELSNHLKSGFVIYMVAILLTIATLFIMPIAFLLLILTIILYIYLLTQIGSAYNNIVDTRAEDPVISSKTLRKTIASVLVILIPLTLGMGTLVISETHFIKTKPFYKNDITVNQNLIQPIRSKMVELGFKPTVVECMPDSEIAHYENIKYVQDCSNEIICDGGILVVTQYISSFDLQNYRYTVYYEWIQKPKVAHAEAVGIILNNRVVRHINQTDFSSLNLYDSKDKAGKVQTYTSMDIMEKHNILHSVKKFKLSNKKGADNFRGYIAASVQVLENQPCSFNNSFYYLRQNTIFNNKGVDLIDINKDKEWFSAQNEDWFFKEYNIMALVDLGKYLNEKS